MKSAAILLLLVSASFGQGQVDTHAQASASAQVSVGWEGVHPIGWATMSAEEQAQFEARMQAAKQELTAFLEAADAQAIITRWSAEEAFALFRHSVNAGFSAAASMDLVKTFILEDVDRAQAEALLKATAEAAVAAEATEKDAGLKERVFLGLGQWVKSEVDSGLRGEALADAIHAQISERASLEAVSQATLEARGMPTGGRLDATTEQQLRATGSLGAGAGGGIQLPRLPK